MMGNDDTMGHFKLVPKVDKASCEYPRTYLGKGIQRLTVGN